MKTFQHRVGSLLLGGLLSLAASGAMADDTELFIASANPLLTGVQPNILFVYDNSGSMESEVITQLPWNPDTTWTGCYDSNRLYWSTGSTAPACGTDRWFDPSVNKCNASLTPLRNTGQFSDKMQEWSIAANSSNNRWRDLTSTNANRNRMRECQDDAGIHGQVSGTYYARNGSLGPWHANISQQISWGSIGQYTLWNGNWLNWSTSSGTIVQSRIEIVRQVTNDLLDDLNGVNVGLMHFNDNQGGTVRYAMENISTARAGMQAAVSGLNAETWTPLSETLYEAANYYMGRNVDYGNTGPVLSVAASRTSGTILGTTYRKPATYACQKNFIVLLTDGLPTQDTGATNKIKALPQWSSNVTRPNCSGASGSDGQCMSDLAEYLHRHDLDSSLSGLQTVTTYTIGFGVDLTLGDTTFLQETASKGGGQYYSAGDTAGLTAALQTIITDILDDATTFSAPTAPVNSFNRTENLDDVFLSIFAPAINRHWPGNIKKYRINGSQLVDANGVNAIDPNTGFFSNSSQSYWSDSVDGNTVTRGGAANELPVHTARNLYTSLNGGDLNASANAVSTSNTGSSGITAARVGAPNDTERDNVIRWARGLDLNDENDNGDTTDVRHVMGDPLHVSPVAVIYGGTASAPDMTLYVSTNDGYLHAIDPDDGSELWAFIPKELLGRLYDLYVDDVVSPRSYGLDGQIAVHIDNNDDQPGINVAGGERVLLYFGMRRGGDTVYAMDVTNRNDPQLLWSLNSATTGFSALGQSWSMPTIAKVNLGGTLRRVAIFGGGYDPGQDASGYRVDASGAAIYMVDALTGQLVWKAGNGTGYNLNLSRMTHSIPAAVRVLDLNQDDLADRMYVGDMGGRVWRFDIINGAASANLLVQGGVFATLGAADISNPALADVRRFYATPDVAHISSGQGSYLAVSLGSGHREHPLDTATDDEFYSLRDFNVFNVLPNNSASYQTPIVRSDLTDITGNASPTLAANVKGWRLRLDLSPGEKVLTESRTFANQLFFTSFSPGGTGDACLAAGGRNRLYTISVRDGSPVTNLDGSTNAQNLTVDDRARLLPQAGIAPATAFLFSDGDDDPNSDADGDGDTDDDDDDNCQTNTGGNPTGPCPGTVPVRTFWSQDGTE
jgi:type IV pilus assembly protein PilY1